MPITATVILVAAVTVLLLLSPRIRNSRICQATVTPLASIIGSGFLVVAPLLSYNFGDNAIWAMLLIIIVAYWVGNAVRFNIVHLEPLLARPGQPPLLLHVESLSRLVLAFAYVISVSFYLQLLPAFLLRGAGVHDGVVLKAVTTAFLGVIGLFGGLRGLHMLELLEDYAVSINLSIITALFAGLVIFNIDGETAAAATGQPITFKNIQALMGMLLIVQGFETSRFLGVEYDADTRTRTMRYAQYLAGLIYIVFIILITPLAGFFHKLNETAIIDLSAHVTPVLPWLLILAATMSQFSAAVADTVSGGGLFAEVSRNRYTNRAGYILVIGLSLIITWTTNIFEVISLASRAFALYYAFQSAEALLVAFRRHRDKYRYVNLVSYCCLTLLMMAIVILGIPTG